MINYPSKEKWDCGYGWFPLITELIHKLNLECENYQIEIVQIKEKFGGLNIYLEGGTAEMYNLIQEYEDKSYEICEECGKPGTYYGELSYKRTFCHKHYLKELSKLRENWGIKQWKNHIVKTIRLFISKLLNKIKKVI